MKLTLTLALVLSACFSQAQVRTTTRTVTLFGDLERQLTAAKGPQERTRYLTDDFEERLCAQPGTPIPHDEWLNRPAVSFSFKQEAVHFYGDVAVYSALATTSKGQQFAVVDTWKNESETWKLAVRFLCPATGEKPSSPIDKRY